jgi:hypothetical protein
MNEPKRKERSSGAFPASSRWMHSTLVPWPPGPRSKRTPLTTLRRLWTCQCSVSTF